MNLAEVPAAPIRPDVLEVVAGGIAADIDRTAPLEDQLAALFRRAAAAAIAADPVDDGGTCNTDTPAFRIERVRANVIEAAAAKAGVRVHGFSWFGGRRWFWLYVPMYGQGERRSTMMQAAQRVLDAAEGAIPGFHACGYYQMD